MGRLSVFMRLVFGWCLGREEAVANENMARTIARMWEDID